jgi:hypothetical protein
MNLLEIRYEINVQFLFSEESKILVRETGKKPKGILATVLLPTGHG